MTDSSLSGKRAIVTGAASGIGAAIATAYADAGAVVAACDIEPDLIRDPRFIRAGLDVCDPGAVCAAFDQMAGEMGGVDVLVSNAGTSSRGTIDTLSITEWDRVIGVNLSGAFYTLKAAAPHMRAAGGGAVVIVASTAAKSIGYLSGAHYTASKAGVLAFARHAAYELGRDNIRVNTVLPGPMENAMRVPHAREKTPAMLAEMGETLPLGHVVKPEEVARAALYLCSDSASMLTGNELYIDGGWLAGLGFDKRQYFKLRGEQ